MFQQVTIIGNLGRDPELRKTQSGQSVCSFSVASSRKFKAGGEDREETVWFRISVWGNSADACDRWLSKGSKVFVQGRLTPDDSGSPRVWTDANGNSRASFEVNAQEVKFLSGGRDGGSRGSGGGDSRDSGQPSGDPGHDYSSGDDLPF